MTAVLTKAPVRQRVTAPGRRRNDYDVTDRIRTTHPAEVRREILRVFAALYPRRQPRSLELGFDYIVALYNGEIEGYHACDTPYHNLQHTLEVALAMARLLDGHERTSTPQGRLGFKLFQLGVVCALFHDAGYIRKRGDRRAVNGAYYTRIHVSRGGRLLASLAQSFGLGEYSNVVTRILHFTGYEVPVATIRLAHPQFRMVGKLLGSADILSQMADRCYLEKCFERLYPEFVEGGIADRVGPSGKRETVFRSPADLLFKTPAFYESAKHRLQQELGSTYRLLEAHFGGENYYLRCIEHNVAAAKRMANERRVTLRRKAPPAFKAG